MGLIYLFILWQSVFHVFLADYHWKVAKEMRLSAWPTLSFRTQERLHHFTVIADPVTSLVGRASLCAVFVVPGANEMNLLTVCTF